MDRNTFIKDVYDKISSRFCQNIPDDKKEIAKEKYVMYLHNSYDKYFTKANDDALSQEAAFCVKKEGVVNLKMNCEEKLAWLFPDENYLKLESLSLEIGFYVRERKTKESLPKTKED